jgi:hypothetical protein
LEGIFARDAQGTKYSKASFYKVYTKAEESKQIWKLCRELEELNCMEQRKKCRSDVLHGVS